MDSTLSDSAAAPTDWAYSFAKKHLKSLSQIDEFEEWFGGERPSFVARYGVDCPFDVRDCSIWRSIRRGVRRYLREDLPTPAKEWGYHFASGRFLTVRQCAAFNTRFPDCETRELALSCEYGVSCPFGISDNRIWSAVGAGVARFRDELENPAREAENRQQKLDPAVDQARDELAKGDTWTKDELFARGWSRKLIKWLLRAPDYVETAGDGSPSSCRYLRKRVEKAERRGAFRKNCLAKPAPSIAPSTSQVFTTHLENLP